MLGSGGFSHSASTFPAPRSGCSGRCSELAPLGSARDAGTRRQSAGGASATARLGPGEPPGPRRIPPRTAPNLFPGAFRDWPTSPTNGRLPPPASLARGRCGQLRRCRLRAPSPRRSRAPASALTPQGPAAHRPLLQAGPWAGRLGQRLGSRPAPPARRLGCFPVARSSSQFPSFAERRQARRGWPNAEPPPLSAASPGRGPTRPNGAQGPSTRCWKQPEQP